jgi:hypothetical protein
MTSSLFRPAPFCAAENWVRAGSLRKLSLNGRKRDVSHMLRTPVAPAELLMAH